MIALLFIVSFEDYTGGYMRLGRMILLLGLILVIAFVGIYSMGGLTSEPEGPSLAELESTQAASAMVDVVYAKVPISRGDRISADKIGVTQLPQNAIYGADDGQPDLMFESINEVVGLFAKYDLDQGAFLTFKMVLEDPVTRAGSDLGSDHAAAIPVGMVAFPIPISRFSGLAYGISPGDRINLIATMAFIDVDTQFQSALPNLSVGVFPADDDQNESATGSIVGVNVALANPPVVQGRAEFDALLEQPFYLVPAEPQRARLVSQTVLQNIVILHVGDFGEEPVVETIVTLEGEPPPPPPPVVFPDIITLIVTPQEAVTLNYLIYSKTELTVALRGIGDETFTPTQAVTLQVLLDTYQIPIPSKLPYSTVPRIDELTEPKLLNDIAAPQ